MALTKTIDPEGRLLAVSGIDIPAAICQAVEDIVDQINNLLPVSPEPITGAVAAASPLGQLLTYLEAKGIISNKTTES